MAAHADGTIACLIRCIPRLTTPVAHYSQHLLLFRGRPIKSVRGHGLVILKRIYSISWDRRRRFKKIAPSVDIHTCSVKSQANCAAWGLLMMKFSEQTAIMGESAENTAADHSWQGPIPHNDSFTIGGRLKSVRYAVRGIGNMLKSQHNAWLHAFASFCVLVTGGLMCLSAGEWCWVVLAIMAVWTAEALNTALEFLADAASPEFHPLVKQAKDVAAGGVLISAMGSVCIGLLVLGPHLLDFLLSLL